jgi:hypothetical protein
MKNRLKLCALFLILAACTFLEADAIPNPPPNQKCPPGQSYWCIGGTDGNPMICYCSAKP